jgi:hypothetical protein
MNDVKEKLVFKSDKEKAEALYKIQEKGARPEDLEEIERISEAEITEQSNTETVPDTTAQPAEQPIVDTTPDENGRNWQITEDLIKQHDETYFDPETKRERNYITHRTAEDFLKSFKESQKYIRHIKDEMLPKKVAAAYEKAKFDVKAEYENKVSELQRKLDEANKRPSQQPAAQPASSDDEIGSILKNLEGISDDDAIEHVGDVKKALIVAMKKLSMSKTDREEILKQADQRAAEKFETYKRERDAELNENKKREEAEKHALSQQQKLREAYTEIDQFLSSKDFPAEYKLEGQKYEDALRDALAFHNELAEVYTGKTKESYDPKTWREIEERASMEFLNKTPQLLEQVKKTGIQEPKNYKKWVFIDNIDAVKTGYFRNPQTNQWERRFDSKSGKEIQFPDIRSAFNYYLDESGLRKTLNMQNGRKSTDGLIEAINKRDAGVVQLDESALSSSGKGQVLTEEEARKILKTIDSSDAIREKMNGKPELYNKINAALIRLGENPLDM